MIDLNATKSLELFGYLDDEAQENLLRQVRKAMQILADRANEWVPTAIEQYNPDELITISFSLLFSDILPGSEVKEFYAQEDLVDINKKILSEMEDL